MIFYIALVVLFLDALWTSYAKQHMHNCICLNCSFIISILFIKFSNSSNHHNFLHCVIVHFPFFKNTFRRNEINFIRLVICIVNSLWNDACPSGCCDTCIFHRNPTPRMRRLSSNPRPEPGQRRSLSI